MEPGAVMEASNRDAFIEAEITYTVDTGEKLVNETFTVGDVARVNSGAYSRHVVRIHNGRNRADNLSIDKSGFTLVEHATAVTDFFAPEQIRSVYYPEVVELVKACSGAARVVVFDHTIRSGDDTEREALKLREVIHSAHNDYTDWSGPQRVRDLFPLEADRLLSRRFAIIQVWRPTHDPVVANPLALADASSVAQEDLLIAERRFPDRVGATYRLTFSARHRWFYFPRMRRDESIVFKTYDSETDGRARFTPHTSFTDPGTPADAPPRRSIEVRAFAFF
jgi:hypothetical protein